MNVDHAALASELSSDPQGFGYSGKTDVEISALLNQMTTGQTISVDFIAGHDAQAAVVTADYTGLQATRREAWTAILASLGPEGFPVNNVGLVAQVQAIWSGTATLTALNSLRTRNGSRAEVLFGENIRVTPHDVAIALGRK